MDEQCSEITFNFWYTLQVGSAVCFALCVMGMRGRFRGGGGGGIGQVAPSFGEAKNEN